MTEKDLVVTLKPFRSAEGIYEFSGVATETKDMELIIGDDRFPVRIEKGDTSEIVADKMNRKLSEILPQINHGSGCFVSMSQKCGGGE